MLRSHIALRTRSSRYGRRSRVRRKSAQVTASAHLCDKNIAHVTTFHIWKVRNWLVSQMAFWRARFAAKFGQTALRKKRAQLSENRTAVRKKAHSCPRAFASQKLPNLHMRCARLRKESNNLVLHFLGLSFIIFHHQGLIGMPLLSSFCW